MRRTETPRSRSLEICLATSFSASMSNPESISSMMTHFAGRSASWSISIFFFSPPENPSFKERERNSLSIFNAFAVSLMLSRKCAILKFFCFAANLRIAIVSKFVTETPETACGCWSASRTPARAISSVFIFDNTSLPKVILPFVIVVAGCASIVLPSVDLPLPLGPIKTHVAPLGTVRSIPFKIALPARLTWRFLMVSVDIPLDQEAEYRAVGGEKLVRHAELVHAGKQGLQVFFARELDADERGAVLAVVLLGVLEKRD